MWTAFITIGLLVVLGAGGAHALDPSTKLHKRFCTRCKRRAEYMQ